MTLSVMEMYREITKVQLAAQQRRQAAQGVVADARPQAPPPPTQGTTAASVEELADPAGAQGQAAEEAEGDLPFPDFKPNNKVGWI